MKSENAAVFHEVFKTHSFGLKPLGAGMTIIGSGSATPLMTLDNQNISQIVETSDEWIISRTGIKKRHLASPTESVSELAAKAAEAALAMAKLAATDVDLIILATSTPDDLFGSACQVQRLLGASRAVAFDLTAACSGFLFGLVTALQFIRTGAYQNILLIGADLLSHWVDWPDRCTCVLFGDGSGAVACQATTTDDRLLGFELRSDGSQNHYLNLSYQKNSQYLTKEVSIGCGGYQPISMNGKEVYRFAVDQVPEVIEKALFRANLTVEQIDWLLLHQANRRIINSIAKRLNVGNDKVLSNVAHYANTSAASIPLALDEAVRQGKIQPGDVIAASAFGAGLSWGATIFQWGK